MDSCGVFVIGPWRGVRLNYDCSLFKIVAPVRTPNNSMVMEVIRDEHGKEINRKPYERHEYLILKRDQVQGYPLSSYLPKNDAKEQHVRWTFDCVQDDQSAVAEQWAATERKPCWYPEANWDFAAESWGWPEMAPCSQKLVDYKKFDPDKTYFARGAHMPLMVFIGDKSKTRRTREARASRTVKQGNRGFPRERIEAMKRGETWSNRGSGAPSWPASFTPSSSSNQAANDPSRTASQDERGWNTGWSSKNNWGWKQ